MSNELQVFENPDLGKIRVVVNNNEPWFVAKDVCEAFGDANYRRSVGRLADDERVLHPVDTLGGAQEMTIVSEPGLYNLLFTMQPQNKDKLPEGEYESRVEKLKSFKRWVTHEVLPSIRKHGAYMTPETIEQALLNPDTLIRLATDLKNSREANKKLELVNSRLQVDNAIMQPKAEYFDELVDRNLLTNFRDTAKQLGVGEKEFINFVLDKKFLYRDKSNKLKPYAPRRKKDKNVGLFEIKEFFNEKTGYKGEQTLITPKGRETFRLLLKGGL